jgi:hypothetical protein
MIKLAVIGSRNFSNKELFNRVMSQYVDEPVTIISGGASGVDKWAEDFANEHHKLIEIIRPINPSDKTSYLFRNVEIITISDRILAFWDGYSKGTGFVIEYAAARGKNVDVFKDTVVPNRNTKELHTSTNTIPEKPTIIRR